MGGGKRDDEKAAGNRCSAFAARGRQVSSSSLATSDMSMVASDEPENAIGVSGICKNCILCPNAYDYREVGEGELDTAFCAFLQRLSAHRERSTLLCTQCGSPRSLGPSPNRLGVL